VSGTAVKVKLGVGTWKLIVCPCSFFRATLTEALQHKCKKKYGGSFQSISRIYKKVNGEE
jgi:hypothetical protein